MYNRFFRLSKSPFTMAPDPGFLFLTAQHREAVAGLTYAILNRKGMVVLIGDAGTGKTTLLARVLQYLPSSQIQSSVILHTTLSPDDFLEMAMLDFGIAEVPASKARRLAALQQFLLRCHREGKIATLIVDEAHKLAPEVLEEIRLLGNFDYADRKLLQIVLLGQNELARVLNRDDLRQLKQRIAVRLHLKPIGASEVEQYMQYRWRLAGGTQFPFSAEAVESVARYSQGIPRLINAVADNALLMAFSEESAAVTAAHVMEAVMDLDLSEGRKLERIMQPAVPETPLPARMAPLRVPGLAAVGASRSSLLMRWAGKLGLAN